MESLVALANEGIPTSIFGVLRCADDALCTHTRSLMIRSLISFGGTAGEVLCIVMCPGEETRSTRDILFKQDFIRAAYERMGILVESYAHRKRKTETADAAVVTSLMELYGEETDADTDLTRSEAWNTQASCRASASTVSYVLRGVLSCAVSSPAEWHALSVALWTSLVECTAEVLEHVVAPRGLLVECDALIDSLLYTARLWNADRRTSRYLSVAAMKALDACENAQTETEARNLAGASGKGGRGGGWILLRRLCDRHDELKRYGREERLCVDHICGTLRRRIFATVVSLRVESMTAVGAPSFAAVTRQSLGDVLKTFVRTAELLRKAGFYSADIDAEALRRLSSPSQFLPDVTARADDSVHEWEEYFFRKTRGVAVASFDDDKEDDADAAAMLLPCSMTVTNEVSFM